MAQKWKCNIFKFHLLKIDPPMAFWLLFFNNSNIKRSIVRYYEYCNSKLYQERVSLSKFPRCYMWMVLEVASVPVHPSICRCPLPAHPCWFLQGQCCKPDHLKITWNTGGLKILTAFWELCLEVKEKQNRDLQKPWSAQRGGKENQEEMRDI